jgi:hypothetical protein
VGCMYVCGVSVHLCIGVYVCLWGRMYVCGDVCMNVGMCICVWGCMYVCVSVPKKGARKRKRKSEKFKVKKRTRKDSGVSDKTKKSACPSLINSCSWLAAIHFERDTMDYTSNGMLLLICRKLFWLRCRYWACCNYYLKCTAHDVDLQSIRMHVVDVHMCA